MVPWNIPRQLIVNRDKPPFDNPELRRAMALTLDRKAFIDILSDGQGDIGGAMLPPPAGSWGMPPEMLQTLPGLRPRCAEEPRRGARDHEEARLRPGQAAGGHGHDPQRPGLSRPGGAADRPAEGDLHRRRRSNAIDTTQWYPTVMRKDYAVGLTVSENGLDDPDQQFYENFVVRRRAQLHRLLQPRGRQAGRPAIERGRSSRSASKLVWEIERKLAEDGARPVDLLPGLGGLLAALRQGPHDDGQQQLQWLALRRRLARQIAPARDTGLVLRPTALQQR